MEIFGVEFESWNVVLFSLNWFAIVLLLVIIIVISWIFSAVNNADIKYSKNPVSEFFSNYSELYCSSFICISHEADTETIVNINQNVFSEIKNLLYICKNQNENDFPDCEGINIMSIYAGKISQSTAGIEL